MVLGVSRLSGAREAEAGRLLCVLLIWDNPLPAEAGVEREGRGSNCDSSACHSHAHGERVPVEGCSINGVALATVLGRFRYGDFVSLAPDLETADLVTLDRVVCCYPELEPLVYLGGQG